MQQIESEHFSYTYNFHNINKTIKSATAQLIHIIKISPIKLLIKIDDIFNNIILRYDNTKIIQCIMNYVSNAYKFSIDGIIILEVKCINKTNNSITIKISVNDTGIGIGSIHHSEIFNLYKQVDN